MSIFLTNAGEARLDRLRSQGKTEKNSVEVCLLSCLDEVNDIKSPEDLINVCNLVMSDQSAGLDIITSGIQRGFISTEPNSREDKNNGRV